MNIISNNCLGGFVYKEVLQMPYSNPLIWHAFVNPQEYSQFIKDFDKLNFENISLSKQGDGLNNFIVDIDGKYKIFQRHMYFDPNATVPTIFGPNNNDVKYNRISEYIIDNFIRRTERMKKEKNVLVLFYDPYNTIKNHQEIVDAISYKNYNGLVFSNQKLDLPKKINQLPVCDNWANEEYGWHSSFMKNYTESIKKIISELDK